MEFFFFFLWCEYIFCTLSVLSVSVWYMNKSDESSQYLQYQMRPERDCNAESDIYLQLNTRFVWFSCANLCAFFFLVCYVMKGREGC